MKTTALNKLAKKFKINLEHFDEVMVSANEKYTKMYVTFAVRENLNGNAYHCGQTGGTMMIAALMKKGEFENDYFTQGWEWIYEIKRQNN